MLITFTYKDDIENGYMNTSPINVNWYNLVLLFPAVSCSPPDLIVPGKQHLLYNCPTLYTLGSTCTLSCSGGYPFAGANQIECAADQNKDLNWRWDPNALQPFCKGTIVNNILDSKNYL